MHGLSHFHHTCPYFGLLSDVDQDLTECSCIWDESFGSCSSIHIMPLLLTIQVAVPDKPIQSLDQDPSYLVGSSHPLHSEQALSVPTNYNDDVWTSQYADTWTLDAPEHSRGVDVQSPQQISHPVEYVCFANWRVLPSLTHRLVLLIIHGRRWK